jgi:hypothetical protein
MESRQPSRGSGSSTPQPPPSIASSTSSAPPKSSAGSTAGSAAGKPAKPSGQLPGKGPKTFEEMGVPSAAKDSDCVSIVNPLTR